MTPTFQIQQGQMQSALLLDQPAPPGLFTPRGEGQFSVYLNAYRARLRGALRDNFETLPLLMGDDAFDELAHAYIDAIPSRNYSLRWFGHELSDFMRAHPGLSLHPAMVDFACLEWAMRHAFDAADAPVLNVADLAHVHGEAWPELRFYLHPSARVLSLSWAVGPIWHALKSGADEVPEPEALAHELLIWRKGLHTQWHSLTAVESLFIQGIAAGQSFATLCEQLAEQMGEDLAAATAASVLRQLLDQGVIARVAKADPV